jgi:ribosomal protein L7/L12
VVGNERVQRLVDEICSMNLLEVADLTELLRKRLGITAPSPGMYAMGGLFTLTEASATVT